MIVTHRTSSVSEMKHVATDAPDKSRDYRIFDAGSENDYDVSFVKRIVDLDNLVDSIASTFYPSDGCNVSIRNVKFNPPATVVFWSDGTKTVVKDESMKGSDSAHVSFDENMLVYKVNDKERTVNYTRWKEDGLLNAIMKKICPRYFALLDKYCS